MWDKEVREQFIGFLSGYLSQEIKIPISVDTTLEIKQETTTGKFY